MNHTAPPAASDDTAQAARELVAAYEATQRQVAGALHDQVSQALGAVMLNLAWCEAAAPEEAVRAELVDELRQTSALVRELTLALRPALLEEAGLVAALEALLRRRCPSEAAPVAASGFAGTDPTTAGLVYRLAEALLAAAQTATAGPIALKLASERGGVSLEVRGDAFAAVALDTLERRCRLFGGDLVRSTDVPAIRFWLPAAGCVPSN